jgi:hypothetical protein
MATPRKTKSPAKPDDFPEARSTKVREIVRRKPVRKDQHIIIRVTAEQKAILRFAAEKAGVGLSGWILASALKAANDE